MELAVKDALKGTSFDLIDDMLLRLYYRIVSNLTDISNYPDTILNYFFTSNYT